MIVTIHQPEHMPWLGFFDKIGHSDCVVFLDNVPFRKNYFQNRNRIMSGSGPMYLTIPVSITESKVIKDVRIAKNFNKRKYLRAIRSAYSEHPFFDLYYPEVERIILEEHQNLSALNLALILFFMQTLQIETTWHLASDLEVNGSKSQLLLSICQKLKADTYLSGPSGRDYLDEMLFTAQGILVSYHDFIHPSYPQINQTGFHSHLSVLDLLFNCGDKSREYLFQA
ncbi:WbqC family protein [Cohnella pontilimi]|nr:WbqC family protein [Cohnella pontilimi]